MLHPNDQSCPFCNGVKLLRFRVPAADAVAEQVNIVECRTCQAGWQWPLQRTEGQSAKVFEQAYAQRDDGSYFDPKKREAVADCQVDFVNAKVAQTGRLLDIGCGDGAFARQMAKQGWDVVGLDPALASPVDEVLGSGRMRLQNLGLSDLPAEQLFDVITMWDVVEHVERPDLLIQAAVARLAPGGALIAETGNYQSAGRVNSRGKWWNYQIDHRWYFAPPQLKSMLTEAGLGRIEMAERVLRPWWKGQRDMPRPRFRSLVKAIVKQPLGMAAAVRRHNDLVLGQTRWVGWGGLEIMTMLGRKDAAPQ